MNLRQFFVMLGIVMLTYGTIAPEGRWYRLLMIGFGAALISNVVPNKNRGE